MVLMRLAVTCVLLVLIASCGSNGAKDPALPSEGFTLEELYPAYISATTEIANISTNELIKVYRELLPSLEDDVRQADVMARIADLESLYQEQLSEQAEQSGDEPYLPDYTLAIEAYQLVLQQFPDQENDAVYYQLAKAYDLSGNAGGTYSALTELVNRYPHSSYFLEAQFRRGDYLFGQEEFKMAQDAYQAVLDQGDYTAFYENAVYMHGWSLFKRSYYEPSLASFSKVLDRTIPESGLIADVSVNQLSLVEDSLRIMSVIFSYMDGHETIAQTYAQLGNRSYEGLLYERLGDLYVDQQRYQDAIDTYKTFVEQSPRSDKAPEVQNKVLNTMALAQFFTQAFIEKERFIADYDVQGDYYAQARPERKAYIRDYLYAYLDEVARFYHARAQKEQGELKRFREPPAARHSAMLADYAMAADYYQRFVIAFADDMHAPEKSFMMGEAFSEIGDFEQAIVAYERTAYDFGLNMYSEDAAYAAVIAYRKLIETEADEWQRNELIRKRLETQLLFVDNFAFSDYAKPVLLDSIDMLYEEKNYEEAVTQSERFLALEPQGTEKERLAVNLVLGHSYFELGLYDMAETAYNQALELLAASDNQQRVELRDRIAASIYRNAETVAAEGDPLEAVDEFLRVVSTAPESKYRKNAEYDAATYLIIAEKWERALDLLSSYRSRYDKQRIDLDITSKMLAAYEGLEQYELAATELIRVSNLSKDELKKRQTLFLAAEYYEKAGNDTRALAIYRDYAHLYPEPFDLAMEVRYKLSEMYRKMDDESRRRYWLEKIIVADRDAGADRTERSRYLAAYSRNVFAEDYLKDFNAIKLTLPLRQSLTAKQTTMQETLRRYQQVLDYEVQEFTTQSLYRVAFIYAQLSRDLMTSDRPQGLNALELEQYDMLLEEQAYPFEETAIEVHESNVQNGWQGSYDKWVQKSIDALAKLLPGRYNKQEQQGGYSDAIY